MTSIVRVKFLYRSAVAELDAGHQFAAGMAVTLLQDAVEALAHDAAALVGANLGARASFLDYWDAVAKVPGGKTLPFRMDMAALNTARVGFKHHGVNPAISDAEKHRAAAHRFLVETTKDFWAVDFDGLSEAASIADALIRIPLELAEEALAEGKADAALEDCRSALDGVEKLMRTVIVVTETNPDIHRLPTALPDPIGGVVKRVDRRLTALEKSVALSILGVNPAEYWFLYQSLPGKTLGGKPFWPQNTFVSKRTPERARACIQIIIDLAIRAERVQADLNRLATLAGLPNEQREMKEFQRRLLEQVTTAGAGANPSSSKT